MPDYTKMRASKTIRVCPKCGRKGKLTQLHVEQSRHGYVSHFDSYKHISEISDFGFESVREHCTVNYRRTPILEVANV